MQCGDRTESDRFEESGDGHFAESAEVAFVDDDDGISKFVETDRVLEEVASMEDVFLHGLGDALLCLFFPLVVGHTSDDEGVGEGRDQSTFDHLFADVDHDASFSPLDGCGEGGGDASSFEGVHDLVAGGDLGIEEFGCGGSHIANTENTRNLEWCLGL